MNAQFLYFFYTLVLAFGSSSIALGRISNDVLTNFWFPDGAVYTSAETNGIVYLGGTFRYVGPYVGWSAFLDATSGARDDGFPQTDGPILGAVPDGSGGWFIGGSFSRVGQTSRSGLAHILANKTVDPAWDVGGGLGGVTALTLVGGNLYIGGQFIFVAGQPRAQIAAVSAANASLQPWDPSLSGVGPVPISAMAASGNTIYIAGNFRGAGGQARTNLAALDATTGNALSWNPNPSQPVSTLLVSGSTVYVGGPFQRISGQNVTNLAALDATSGAVLSWPNDRPNGAVSAMALNAGTLYLAGAFRQLGSTGRIGYGALNVGTGNATPWNPGSGQIGDSNAVSAVTLAIAGSTVYVGGGFSMCGGLQRLRVAAVDATSGNAIAAWNPGANGRITRLFIAGNRVLASGEFTSIDGAKRNNIAAIDTATGAATAWNANASGGINAIVASSNVIFAAGAYTNIGGQLRYGIAALDLVTGAATSWNPAGTPPVNSFQALLLSGNTLYAAGSLVASNRTNAVAFNTASGAVLAWNPFPNSIVNTLAKGNGVIYAGGGFARIGGLQMTNLAALDPITGAATAWNPRVDRPVHALAVNGNSVFAGGLFYRIGGQSRTNFGAVDAISGNAINFPDSSYSFAGGGVYGLALVGTNSLLVGGAQFEDVGGTVGGRLFELDLATGTTTSWSPGPDRPSSYLGTTYIQDVAVGANKVYVSGDYSGGFVAYTIQGTPTAPQLTMPFWNDNMFSFRLLGDDSQEYTIEYSEDLGFWQFLGFATPANGFIDIIDPTAFSNQRTYRAYAP